MQNNLKKCTGCLVVKETSEFYKNRSSKDGLAYRCIPCRKDYYDSNKESHKKKMKEHYARNSESYKNRAKKWKAENRAKHNASCMERYVLKMQRSPEWAKELTDLVCLEAYDKAKRLSDLTGVSHDVDHIIPLRGKTVSGLHIYSNFQVIPARENRSKKHLHWPDMWEGNMNERST